MTTPIRRVRWRPARRRVGRAFRYELGYLLVERGKLDVGALQKLSKASVGAKGTTVRLDSAKANGLLAAKLRSAREFAANSVF